MIKTNDFASRICILFRAQPDAIRSVKFSVRKFGNKLHNNCSMRKSADCSQNIYIIYNKNLKLGVWGSPFLAYIQTKLNASEQQYHVWWNAHKSAGSLLSSVHYKFKNREEKYVWVWRSGNTAQTRYFRIWGLAECHAS